MLTFHRWDFLWPDSTQRRITTLPATPPAPLASPHFWWACLCLFCWTSTKTSSFWYLFFSTSFSYLIFVPPDQSFSSTLPFCSIFLTCPWQRSSSACLCWTGNQSSDMDILYVCYMKLYRILHVMDNWSAMKLFPWLIHLNMSSTDRSWADTHWECQDFEDCFDIFMTECQSWSSLMPFEAWLRTNLKYSWRFCLFVSGRQHLAIISQPLFLMMFPVSCSMYFALYWRYLLRRWHEFWSKTADSRFDHCQEYQKTFWRLACCGSSIALSLVCSLVIGSWCLAVQIGSSHSFCAKSTTCSWFYL